MKKSTILGLRTVVYKVADLEKAKHWYSKAFEQEPYFDEPFYVGFNLGGYELGLQPIEGKVITGDSVISYWGVNKVQPTYKHMLSLGAKTHEAPQEVGSGIVVASVVDPWGNVIGLIFNPHFQPTP